MHSTTLTDDQQRLCTVVVKDKKGNIDPSNPVSWSTDDPTVATVVGQDPIGRTVLIVGEKPGVTNAIGKCGAAVVTIAINITASDDQEIDASFGDAIDQVDAATGVTTPAPASTASVVAPAPATDATTVVPVVAATTPATADPSAPVGGTTPPAA